MSARDDLAALRRAYERAGLAEADLAATWDAQLGRWVDDAVGAGVLEPTAMVLATASPEAVPSARTVLLKGLDESGLVLYTNRTSRKGAEAAANPHAAAVLAWPDLQRQVTVHGAIEPVDDATSDAYFASRPHGSRLGALASPQSQVIASRDVLDARAAELAAEYPEGSEVPRPPQWGGLRIMPVTVEFWQGRADRLHDRLRYRCDGEAWVVERLAP